MISYASHATHIDPMRDDVLSLTRYFIFPARSFVCARAVLIYYIYIYIYIHKYVYNVYTLGRVGPPALAS